MKRFACHRLYLSTHIRFTRYVVELEDDGKVQSYYPLEEEICGTQWIGGVIVLSERPDLDTVMAREKFKDFLARTSQVNTKAQECYAWHIAEFDISQEEFVPQSRIVRL